MPAYIAANPGKFSGIEIYGLYLHPGTVWIEGDGTTPGEEREALMGGTDFMNLAGFVSDSVDEEISGDSGATVTLTYPKSSGGTGTIDLVYLSHHGDGEGYWGIDPWREAEMLNPSGTDGPVRINPDRIVSDFTSGTYTVTIVVNGTTTSKSFEKKVITGMTDKYSKLISPQGMPIWPGSNASQDEMAAFDAEWEAFYINGGRTNFTANVDAGGNPATGDAATKAKITVTWEAPDVVLPDGVKMVYNLDIGQGGCDENGCYWNPIWNSWEADKPIYTTSFVIPHLFDIQTVEDAQNNPFHLNIGVSFINQATGEHLGSGGHAHTEFTVGEAIDPTASFTIRGLNAINISDETINAAGLRAALIKESHDGTTFTQTIVKIADIVGETGYSLELQIRDFINSGTTMNSWYNIILVEDANDELQAGDNLGIVPMYWPDYSSGGMWFDTWGGVLKIGKDSCTTTGECVHEEIIVTGGEVVDGPKLYIGQDNYAPPSPDTLDAVAPEVLAQTFTITGSVDTTDIEGPKIVLIKEGYNSATDMYLQTVIRIAAISGTDYSIDARIADFFDSDGKPTDNWYQIVMVSDPEGIVAVGEPLGYLPMWWPDWTNGSFGFDTWRGGELVIYTDTLNPDGSWTHTEVINPDDTTPVTGPSLANIDYGTVDNTDPAVQ